MEILDPKTKEFVGIAAAVAGLCQPCFDYHFAEAQKLGITLEEVRATVRLAQAVRQAGKSNMDKYVQAKLDIQEVNEEPKDKSPQIFLKVGHKEGDTE